MSAPYDDTETIPFLRRYEIHVGARGLDIMS